jgi:hypothetical protein
LRFLALHVIDTAQQRAILAGKEYQLEEREEYVLGFSDSFY